MTRLKAIMGMDSRFRLKDFGINESYYKADKADKADMGKAP